MSAAEARAAWQRTANRCFVQEDAKRGPKFACCPSSSATIQQDLHKNNEASRPDFLTHAFTPLNWDAMYSNLPPDSKWWLYMEPDFRYQKDFTSEQSKAVHDVSERMGPEFCFPATKKLHGDLLTNELMEVDLREINKPLGLNSIGSTAIMKNNCDISAEEMKKANCDDPFSVYNANKGLDSRAPSMEENKSPPWWRISDKDELASLVAKKSQQYVDNCDLPTPSQLVHFCSAVFLGLELGDGETVFSPSITEISAANKDPLEHRQSLGTPNSSRDHLLQALHHSQTRAREAEIAAQKACNDKEHVIKLLFRQASQLFACKQWLHILQLETLSLHQLKVKEHLQGKGKGKKKTRKVFGFCRYAVAVLLGLGLTGTGLLLGWTLAWLLPPRLIIDQ